jgi:hypothetical protein
MEKVTVENKVMHENCFKCAHCKKKLTPGNYTSIESTFYCLPHYTQLFTAKGNYSEGFGKEKPTAGWTATPSGVGMKEESAKTDTKKPEEKKIPETQAKPSGAPAPPPPGPPPPPAVDLSSAADEGSGSTSAHAAALDAIRTGGHNLKHLTREERKQKPISSVVPDSKPKQTTKSFDTAPPVKKGTPEVKLDNGKWSVRFQDKVEEPINVKITDMKQSVNISDSVKCVVIIIGKAANVSLVNCDGVSVIFDDIIATVEVVRSRKIALQANGRVAQILIDKTSGIDIYIQSEIGKETEIVSSISDSINVNYPGLTPDDDPIEFPIPSQFTSTIVSGKLKTIPVEHV